MILIITAFIVRSQKDTILCLQHEVSTLHHACLFEELYWLPASLDYREKAIRVAEVFLEVMQLGPFVECRWCDSKRQEKIFI